jgi:hypothetical protein
MMGEAGASSERSQTLTFEKTASIGAPAAASRRVLAAMRMLWPAGA